MKTSTKNNDYVTTSDDDTRAIYIPMFDISPEIELAGTGSGRKKGRYKLKT